jgi:hypothetical protein
MFVQPLCFDDLKLPVAVGTIAIKKNQGFSQYLKYQRIR